MRGKFLPVVIGCLLSACANTADDYGNSIVGGVRAVGAAVDRQFSSPTRFEVPFDAGTVGRVQRKQFGVELERDYAVTLRLHFEEGGAEARERVVRVAGARPGDPGGLGGAGLLIPVRLKIAQIKGGFLLPVYESAVPDHGLDGYAGSYYSRGIGVAHLGPGLYQMTIEAMQDVPALAYVPVTVALGPAPGR